jgi:hypothetical protein
MEDYMAGEVIGPVLNDLGHPVKTFYFDGGIPGIPGEPLPEPDHNGFWVGREGVPLPGQPISMPPAASSMPEWQPNITGTQEQTAIAIANLRILGLL